MASTVRQVSNRRELTEFVRLPRKIYCNDPLWVPPLQSDALKELDPRRGVFYQLGEAALFILYRDGDPVGRISAHVNFQYEKYQDTQTGFFGFFECERDQQSAEKLLETAGNWLREKGKRRMIGPMSFTVYDECGILCEGFDTMPVVLVAYNPPYYNDLVKGAGFEKVIDWYAFMVSRDLSIRPLFYKIRDRVMAQKDLRIVTLEMKHLDRAVADIAGIFKHAWSENWGHVPLTEGQVRHMVGQLKPVVVPELTYLAYLDGKCIGFSLSVKDVNPALQRANGRLFPFGFLKILMAMPRIHRIRTIAMGVLKPYRHRGIDIAFYLNTIEKGVSMGYVESECSIIVESNKRMIGALEDLSARRYKTFRIYGAEL